MPMATKGTVVPNPFQPVMIDTIDREALFGGLISAGHTVEYARVQADTLPSTDGALQMLARHRLQSAAAATGEVEREKARIAEVIAEDGGCWTACSGCQESCEGYVSTKDYPYDARFQCQPGGGCRECGGIGVIWWDGKFLSSYGDALAPTDDSTGDAAREALADAVIAVMPSGIKDHRVPDDKVFPLYLRMGEIRSLANLATLAKGGAEA